MLSEKMEKQIQDFIDLLVEKKYLNIGRSDAKNFVDELRKKLQRSSEQPGQFLDLIDAELNTQLPTGAQLYLMSIFNVNHIDQDLKLIILKGTLQRSVNFDVKLKDGIPTQAAPELEKELLGIPIKQRQRTLRKKTGSDKGKKR